MLTVLSNRIQINLQIIIAVCMLNVLEIMALDKKEAGFFSQKYLLMHILNLEIINNIGCFQFLHAYILLDIGLQRHLIS